MKELKQGDLKIDLNSHTQFFNPIGLLKCFYLLSAINKRWMFNTFHLVSDLHNIFFDLWVGHVVKESVRETKTSRDN